MDPQSRVLLQAAHAALEDAGYAEDSTPTFQRDCFGCYIGVATGDYTDNLRDNIDVYYSPGKRFSFESWNAFPLTRNSFKGLCELSLVERYPIITK